MLLVIVWLLLAIGLLCVTAMRPAPTSHSRFELERRGSQSELRREKLLGGVQALLWLVAGLLIVCITGLSVVLWQGWGVVDALLLVAAAGLLSHVSFVGHPAMRFYNSQEEQLLHLVERFSSFRWLARKWHGMGNDQKIESTEHLLHLIDSAEQVLTHDQQRLLKRSLSWHTAMVKTVMTPAKDIVSVTHRELLGPLVLDDLHRSGHRRFPVTRGGVDHIIGQINIGELLEVDAGKRSQTAEKVMTPNSVRLAEETLLPEALEQMLDLPGQLGLVVDSDGKTVGLVSMSDILGALLG
jgi:CBS domain containing-hemolysin-like protein